MRKIILASIIMISALSCFSADTPVSLIPIGDPGNPGKRVPHGQFVGNVYPRGGVDYTYCIGTDEVTQVQYCNFLNECPDEYLEFAYHPESGIIKLPNGIFTPAPNQDNTPVHSVSRAAAALWCNWASKADVYKLEIRTTNKTRELWIVGERDLFTPESGQLFYIPDLDEFYKAGFYDGNGNWRTITSENRFEKSHFGMNHVADGVSEWIDSHYVESTYALGANDTSQDAQDWNAITLHKAIVSDSHYDTTIGFRVAATAPIAIAPRLNDKRNFFGPDSSTPVLRLRSNGTEQSVKISYKIQDYFEKIICEKTELVSLDEGINDLPIDLPEHDGYYVCNAVLPDGTNVSLPFEVMREQRHPETDGNFGLCGHIIRSERGWCREPFPCDLFRETGADWIRTDAFLDGDIAYAALKKLKDAGIKTCVVLTGPFRPTDWGVKSQKAVDKWAPYGIIPELADNVEKMIPVAEKIGPVSDVFEMGNEPQWWWSTPEDYAGYIRTLSPILRNVAPNTKLMCSDLSSCARPILELGGGDDADILSVHTYCNYNANFWGIVGWMRRLNAVAKANGAGEKPFWMTETNICTYSSLYLVPLDDYDDVMHYEAMMVSKDMISQLAYGCEKVFIYVFQDPVVHSREESFGLIDRHGLPKPAFATYRLTAESLATASFAGFLKGHQVAPGKISAFGFNQKNGMRTAAFWRNDSYMFNEYKVPFAELVKPKEIYRLPGNGTAELRTMDGKLAVLKSHDGYFNVPVDEYPCLVTGNDLKFEFIDEKTSFDYEETIRPEAFVQILPTKVTKKTIHQMGGFEISAVPNGSNEIRVRIHNLTDKPMEGHCRLLSPSSWQMFDWDIVPQNVHISIPARGFTTAVFSAHPNADFVIMKDGIDIKCIFTWDKGKTATDKVKVKPVPELDATEWQTPATGWTLSAEQVTGGLLMKWEGEHRPCAMAYYKSRPVFAVNYPELAKSVLCEFDSNVKITAVALLTVDTEGETFMLHRRLPAPASAGRFIFDCQDLIKEGKFISYDGNKDKVIQYPLTLQGITFDIQKEHNQKNSGCVILKKMRIQSNVMDEQFEELPSNFKVTESTDSPKEAVETDPNSQRIDSKK